MGDYSNLYSSVIRVTTDLIAEIRGKNLSQNLQYINWDAHVENKEIPQTDLLGIRHFNVWPEDGGILQVGVGFGVSTHQDENLFRHVAIIDHVFEAMKKGKVYSLLEALSGDSVTFMKVMEGTSVPPMYQTDTRQLQFVLVTFGTGATA